MAMPAEVQEAEDKTLECRLEQPVQAFLQKLWAIVNDESIDDLICWSKSGKSFIVKNQDGLANTILPKYFKHRNFSSFIRQLNLYCFLRSSGLGTNAIIATGNVEFGHHSFVRGRPELMSNIKRKVKQAGEGECQPKQKNSAPAASTVPPLIAAKPASVTDAFSQSVVDSLDKLHKQQEHIMGTLQEMNRDNRGLWTEIISLRRSVQRHENIIEKLVKFIAHIFQTRGIVQSQKRKRFAYDSHDAIEAPAKRPSSPTRFTQGSSASSETTSKLLEELLSFANSQASAPSGIDLNIPLGTTVHDLLAAANDDSNRRDVVAYTGGGSSGLNRPQPSGIIPLDTLAASSRNDVALAPLACSSGYGSVSSSGGLAVTTRSSSAAASAASLVSLPSETAVATIGSVSSSSAAGGPLTAATTTASEPLISSLASPQEVSARGGVSADTVLNSGRQSQAVSEWCVMPSSVSDASASSAKAELPAAESEPLISLYTSPPGMTLVRGDAIADQALDSGNSAISPSWGLPYDRNALQESVLNIDQGIDSLVNTLSSSGVLPQETINRLLAQDTSDLDFDRLLGDGTYFDPTDSANLSPASSHG